MIPEKWLTDVCEQIVKDNIQDDNNSSMSEMSQMKYVIEHKFDSPRQPQQYPLPPITQRLPGAPPPVIVHQQQQPQIIPMQQPNPQIIQVPAPQHIIAGNPSPVIHNLGDRGPPENKGMFNKADFGEMMMMQNCQMHQMVMQKLMIGNLGRQDNDHHGGCHDCHDCHSGCCSSHGVHGGSCGHGGGGGGCYDCLPVPRLAGGAVHHHHYTNPPPSQPAVSHYTTMPAMDIRGSYPYAGYSSAYTGPGYTYGGYDGGENYYTYH